MNIISVIKTNNVKDIPNALRDLANMVEKDIATMGHRANSCGMFDRPNSVSGDFDYQIDQTDYVSIHQYLTAQK